MSIYPCCDHAEVAVVTVVAVAVAVVVVVVVEGDECNDVGYAVTVVVVVVEIVVVVAVLDGTAVVSSLADNGSDECGIDAGGADGTTTTGSCTGDVPCLALAYAGARS